MGALGQIEVVVKFNCKTEENNLSEKKLRLSLDPVELALWFLFGWLLGFQVEYFRGCFLFWWLFERLFLFEFKLSQIVDWLFKIIHL